MMEMGLLLPPIIPTDRAFPAFSLPSSFHGISGLWLSSCLVLTWLAFRALPRAMSRRWAHILHWGNQTQVSVHILKGLTYRTGAEFIIMNHLITNGSSLKCPLTVFQDKTVFQANQTVISYGNKCSQGKITDSSGNALTYRIWPIPAATLIPLTHDMASAPILVPRFPRGCGLPCSSK